MERQGKGDAECSELVVEWTVIQSTAPIIYEIYMVCGICHLSDGSVEFDDIVFFGLNIDEDSFDIGIHKNTEATLNDLL